VAQAKRLSVVTSVPERRSQAERTAETRARIMRGVLESIAAVGFQRTTAAEITRRAGVTWGAVQHHFGDKDGILVSVLEDSFDRFAAHLDDIPVEGTGLPKRAALFVDGAWAHFGSAEYRSTFEILLHDLGRDDAAVSPALRPSDSPSWQGPMFQLWDRTWMQIFADAPLTRRRHRVLEHYTVSVLSGLATMNMLEGTPTRGRRTELAYLKDTLTRELAGHGA